MACLLMQVVVLTMLYNDQLIDYSLPVCRIIPVLSVMFGHLSLWISSFIAVERTLVECFNLNFYRTRKQSFIVSIILLILLTATHVHKIIARKMIPDPTLPTSYYCTFQFSHAWAIYDRTLNHLHLLLPCLLHFLATICVLTSIAKRKIFISESRESFWKMWFQQLGKHKDFLIPPFVIILCTMPHVVFIDIKYYDCVESFEKFYLRFHIATELLFYIPQILTFFIYVYPSMIYKNEYFQSKAGQKIQTLKFKILSICGRN
ncbi:unnamed protein product [Didymodactylos carnosus]|uniref:G-protein coupled receptors family 1 profile domain-containing protein n=2 Tax=Didymodactylos carnosus TaxID=1234261 RepID=A0A816D395_9BILA|nr:unnamed protein product [Didymodactylos carnosus]CAF4526922.1 unnamed protein product [Didymodactylos carnosus]